VKILLLTQIIPYPPDSGPKVKTYHVLRYLAERGYQVTLASFVRDEEKENLENLRPFCTAIHAVPMRRSKFSDARAYVQSLRADQPFLVTRDASTEMTTLVQSLTRERNLIVHADQLSMGQFALEAKDVPRLLDAHNAVWTVVARAQEFVPSYWRFILAHETERLQKYEGRLCSQMNAVLTVSRNDANALVDVGADPNKIAVIPIAIDCVRYQVIPRSNGVANILVLGTLFYPPNADGIRWFIQKIFLLIQKRIPGVRLTIVGARPTRDIINFARRNQEFVTVTGYVDDLKTHLEQASVMVVPVRVGSGMRVRLLEAFARGIPVVTTSMGAEGIEARHEEHVMIADEELEFAEQTIRLLQDECLRERLVANARRLVEEKFDWRVVLPKLETVYESITVN
jgi:glycosyltransferase involved in cell wall biosynthesis